MVSPRPIGWISTVDGAGRTNLAPYSFFNAMAFLPPVVVFGSGTKADGSPKDSQRNVEATGEFVCNIVSEALKARCKCSVIDREPRTWERPSDHAPVIIDLD